MKRSDPNVCTGTCQRLFTRPRTIPIGYINPNAKYDEALSQKSSLSFSIRHEYVLVTIVTKCNVIMDPIGSSVAAKSVNKAGSKSWV